MLDNDQRLKTVFMRRFAEALEGFFGPWTQDIDPSEPEFLKNDLFPYPPGGERKAVDILAKVKLRKPVRRKQQNLVSLVLLEIEGRDSVETFGKRLYDYWHAIEKEYGLPVLPTVIFTRKGLDGINVGTYKRTFSELTTLTFQYVYAGLPSLDAVEICQRENWLQVALSGLMKIPKGQEAMLAAESLRRLCDAPLNDQDRYLLAECVEAYSDLDPVQKIVYDEIVLQKAYSKVRTMNKTTREKGIEEGISKGIEQGLSLGQQKTFRNLLDSRFGPLPKKTVERIEKLSDAKIDELIPKLWKAESLKELGL